MFAISTVWNAWRQFEAELLVAELESIGFQQVELSAFLPTELVRKVISIVASGRIKVSSIHNFCPAPLSVGNRRVLSSGLSLSSRNERERNWAVRQTFRTFDAAKALGASAVVLHLGEVPLTKAINRLFALYRAGKKDTPVYKQVLKKVRLKREKKKEPYIKQVIKSLIVLADYAGELHIKMGLETRFYPVEIPSLEEIEEIMDRVSSPMIGYWHDMGHAQVRENLGWEDHEEYFRRYGNRLIGMHIHDVTGVIDHQPPLRGELDFVRFKDYLKRDIVKVLEIHPPAAVEDIRKAHTYLQGLETTL